MDKASEVILALNPVTFRYKKELDPNGVQQFGLVAEEVEERKFLIWSNVIATANSKPFATTP